MPINGKRLATRRKDKGYTQQQIADMLGIKQQIYARYESGDRQPGRPRLNRFCEILDCSPDWLLDLTSDPHEYTKQANLGSDQQRLLTAWETGDIATLSEMFRRRFQEELFK